MPNLFNKKIVYIILLIVTIILLGLCIKMALNISKLPEGKLILQCESHLQKQADNFQVCKINDNKIIPLNEVDLDKEIKASDKLIISLNLKKLLQAPWQNADTMIAIDKNSYKEPISLCFAIYPVMVPSHFATLFNGQMTEEQQIQLSQEYINNFKWAVTPVLKTEFLPDGSNVACTQPFEIKDAKTISFILPIPQSSVFQKGIIDPDFHKYGVKVVLASTKFTINQIAKMDIVENLIENKDSIVPMTILKHWIQF